MLEKAFVSILQQHIILHKQNEIIYWYKLEKKVFFFCSITSAHTGLWDISDIDGHIYAAFKNKTYEAIFVT